MSFQENYDLLKSLHKRELSEISKNNNLRGYSSLKQKELAR